MTPFQERDLIALTALYVVHFDTPTARGIVNSDTTITDAERQLLISAIDLFQTAASATASALGNPLWVEK